MTENVRPSVAERLQRFEPDGYLAFRPSYDIFHIRGLKATIDPLVLKALRAVSQEYSEAAQEAKEYVRREGLSASIYKVTNRFNRAGLDETTRLLLSAENVYPALILKAVSEEEEGEKIKGDDTLGIFHSVRRNVEGEPKTSFHSKVLGHVLTEKNIDLPDPLLERLVRLVREQGVPIREGKVVPVVLRYLDAVNRDGTIPYYVDLYTKRQEISEAAFTPAIKKAMVDYLVHIGVNFKDVTEQDVNDGKYDEYFALAYNHALRQSAAATDPIDAANTKGQVADWDFTVDTHDAFEDQVVIPTNIKAAGALYYIYCVGEMLHIYDVADALVLRWAKGYGLDIPEGEAAAALYRYYKKRREREDYEGRAMLYRRVLNLGEARVLSGMVINETFETLWFNLMSEVTKYISKSESKSGDGDHVSRTPVFQATRELQYNLTEHMTGMAHLQVTEMYAHLQEATELMRAEEVVDHFGGRRRGMWHVAERVAAEDLDIALQTSPLRTMAAEGYNVFDWIASFDQKTYAEDGFQALLNSAEAWIIAQASVGDGAHLDEEEDEFDDDVFEDKEEFSDWED